MNFAETHNSKSSGQNLVNIKWYIIKKRSIIV